jgi:hypothetical protein
MRQNTLRYRYPHWRISPDIHAFLLQGTDDLHLVYLPVFHEANHRRQVIARGRLESPEAMNLYTAAYRKDSQEPFVVFTTNKEVLLEMLSSGSFIGDIYHGRPERYWYVFCFRVLKKISPRHSNDESYKPIISGVRLSFTNIIKNRPLDRRSLDNKYTEKTPFYLYGTSTQQHIDHVLLCAPNVQLTASNITLSLKLPLSEHRLARGLTEGLIVVLDDEYERIRQPFGQYNQPSFFVKNAMFNIKVYEDRRRSDDPTRGMVVEFDQSPSPITTGILMLGEDVSLYRDHRELNRDVVEGEKAQADQIASAVGGL